MAQNTIYGFFQRGDLFQKHVDFILFLFARRELCLKLVPFIGGVVRLWFYLLPMTGLRLLR